MRSLGIAASLISFLIITTLVQADFNQALFDYKFQLDQYKKSYSEFGIARAKYQSFKTLPAEAEAFKAEKQLLADQTKVLQTHFSVLGQKMGESPKVDQNIRNDLTSKLTQIQDFLFNHLKKAEGAKTITDLENLSKQIKEKSEELTTLSVQVRESIFLGQLTQASEKFQNFHSKLSRKIAESRLELTDLELINGWMTEAGQKIDQTTKLEEKIKTTTGQLSVDDRYKRSADLDNIKKDKTEIKKILAEVNFRLNQVVREVERE